MAENDNALVERCKRLWDYAQSYYKPRNDRIERELAFALKLRHYELDTGETRDHRRLRFRGRELYSKLRRKTADIIGAPLYIETIPNGAEPFNAELAETAKYALEHDIRDEDKGFEVYAERMVMGALAARIWSMAVDYDADCGPFGEILFRNVDPTRLYKTPGYQDIWDKRLPWVIEEDDIRLEDCLAQPGWMNTELLYAEDTQRRHFNGGEVNGTDDTGAVIVKDSGQDEGTERKSGRVKVIKCWFKYDDSTKKQRRDSDARELEPDEWHLACVTCGYKTDESAETPEMGMCPECGEMMERAEMAVPEDTVRAYPNGRLVIVAPNQGVVLYDGTWPFRMRHYPYCEFKCNEHPIDDCGLSDTALDWYPQVASNAAMRRLYDQVMSAPNLIIAGGSVMTDAYGRPFEFTDEPWQVAYFNDPAEAGAVRQFAAQPLSGDIGGLYNLLQSNLRADMGTADLGGAMDANRSKDIPVGTVNAIVENQNIPTNHHIRSYRRALAPFLGVVHDIQRETWTMPRWVAFKGPEGVQSAQMMRGSAMPNVKFRITTSPEFKARTKEELSTLMFWMQQGAGEALATMLGIPPTQARLFKQEMEKQKQEAMQAQAEQAMAGPGGPAGGPMPGPEGPPMGAMPPMDMGDAPAGPMDGELAGLM